MGFRIMYDTLDEWVVISPERGARIIFKRDTGRCDRFSFVYLDDAATQAFLDTAHGEVREGETISEHFHCRSHNGSIITKYGQ